MSPRQYKSLGIPQLNRAYVQRALLDENVQYLLLAVYWFLQVSIREAIVGGGRMPLEEVLGDGLGAPLFLGVHTSLLSGLVNATPLHR